MQFITGAVEILARIGHRQSHGQLIGGGTVANKG
jgi:hypothetical protein